MSRKSQSASTGVFARLSHAYETKNENTLSSTAAIKTWRQSIKTIVPITPIEFCAPNDYILKFPEDEELRRDARDKIPEKAWFGRFKNISIKWVIIK